MVDKSPEYLMNKGGVFYFTRHVPNDLQQHYERPRIVMCLRTASKKAALRASHALASKLDDFWLKMRISDIDTPASHLLVKGQIKEVFKSSAPTLSDSLATYCSLKGQDRAKMFFTAGHMSTPD